MYGFPLLSFRTCLPRQAVWCAMFAVFASACLAEDKPGPKPTTRKIDVGSAMIEVDVWGKGETIVAIPGLGSDSSDFRSIAPILAAGGYRFVAVNQRGIRGSTGRLEALTLNDLGEDVVKLAEALHADRVHLLGWALGNRIARLAGMRHPERTFTITLLAAGGLIPPSPELSALSMTLFSDPARPQAETFSALRKTLFSPAAGDALLRDYLENRVDWPEARAAQLAASRSAALETWWSGGNCPMLIVQGLDDQMAPAANGRAMQQQFGKRIELVEIDHAAHLMALERPAETASAILAFLAKHRGSGGK